MKVGNDLARWAAATLLAVLLSACGSVQEHRIRQMRHAFDTYPAPTCSAIRAATIERGFTPMMVYLAWGQPTATRPSGYYLARRAEDPARAWDKGFVDWFYTGWLAEEAEKAAVDTVGSDAVFTGKPTARPLHPPFRPRSDFSFGSTGNVVEMRVRFYSGKVIAIQQKPYALDESHWSLQRHQLRRSPWVYPIHP